MARAAAKAGGGSGGTRGGGKSAGAPARRGGAKGSARAKERTLGQHNGAMTPASISFGFFMVLLRAVREPLRLFPAFLVFPAGVAARIKAQAVQDAADAVKFFIFAVVVVFTIGAGLELGVMDAFALDTELDEIVFEISCFIFLVLWSNIQFLILRVWSRSKKLFQIVLTVNAGYFGYMLLVLVITHLAASLCALIWDEGFESLGTDAATFWETMRWALLVIYGPLLFVVAYIGWMATETKLARSKVIISFALATLIAGELIYFTLEGLRALVAWLQPYGAALG